MLAQSAAPFDSDAHLFEIKWDGTRCIVFVGPDGVRLQNRRFFEMQSRYPEFACLQSLPPGVVLDAEIIVLDQGKPSFNKLAQREHNTSPTKIEILARQLPATMMVFDLLYLNFQSLLDRPLLQRRGMAEEVVAHLSNPHVVVPSYILQHGQHYFEQLEQLGLEGMMAKRLQSPYQPGKRTPDWLKVKAATTAEFDIIGYEQRQDQPFVSALVIGMIDDRGRLLYKGKVGSGFNEEQRQDWFRRLSTAPPLEKPPADAPRGLVWRRTALRCRVRYFEKTESGKLRAPVFMGLVT